MESISGTIERVTFHNPESGFAVLRVKTSARRGLVTVVGQAARVVAGEYLEASGVWQRDPEHGDQFKAQSLRTMAPSSVEGIEKYLGSGLIRGIGPHFAKRIVAVFGAKTLDVIEQSPTFLKEIRGIGPRRIQQIRQSWQQQKAVRDIIVFLQTHGLGTNRAVRIYKTYGDKAVEIVRANPYRLADDIWGIGFATADELAKKLGIDPMSVQRAQAALRHLLKEASYDGHCAVPEDELVEAAEKLTGIPLTTLRGGLADLVATEELMRETEATPAPWIYLRTLFFAESNVARIIHELLRGSHPLVDIDVERALAWVQERMHLELAPGQREAIRQAVTRKVLIVTGGPGVGKTTIVRGILDILRAKKLTCRLAAPTGRAAKRLSESTGQEASTIHRLLEYDGGGPQRDAERRLDLDALIVDEASMIDISLLHQMIRALPVRACLVLVGDVDQLPSVGPGQVLADLIASKAVPVVRLTDIFRQAQDSLIVQAAHAILRGETPTAATAERPGDFYFIEADEPSVILERLLTTIQERIPARFGLNPFRDVQVLTPMNRTELGVYNLNQKLQQALNPRQTEDQVEAVRFGTAFRVGDKVLQTVNNYDRQVFNGDVGRVHSIALEEQELIVDFDGLRVPYDLDELDELSLAYALTIHKSQGSEYPAVVIPLHTQHFVMLQRNLIYTALTRGKKLVVLIGSRKALEMAIRRQETRHRYTALASRMRDRG